jgi:hypothetical protein
VFCVYRIGASLMRGVMRHDLKALAALIARQRQYAGFFAFGDKQATERTVAQELTVALRMAGFEDLPTFVGADRDPPDLVGETTFGGKVGIEITEAVSQDAVEANAQSRAVYRHWQTGEFAQLLSRRISEKDAKVFHGGPFERLILCIHTDEPEITHERAMSEAAKIETMRLHQIHAVYLLLSYDPTSQRYPVVRLTNAA